MQYSKKICIFNNNKKNYEIIKIMFQKVFMIEFK